MTKFLDYLKTKKKLGYLLITLVLLLLFVSLLTARGTETLMTTNDLGANAFRNAEGVGYEVTQNADGTLTFLPNAEDPRMLFDLGEGMRFNRVIVSLNQAVDKDSPVQLLYEEDHLGWAERTPYQATLGKGSSSVVLELPTRNYTKLRLDIDGDFSPASIRLEMIEREVHRECNWLALILLVSLIVLLVILNSKIGYISFILGAIKNALQKFKSEKQENGIWRALLYGAMLISTAAYAVTLAVLLLLSHLSLMAIGAVFALSTLALLFQLLWRGISREGNQPAKLFLTVILIVGLMFAYCLPITTGLSWDDQIHYQRAENISRLIFGHQSTLADYDQAIFLYPVHSNIEDFDNVNTRVLVDSQNVKGESGGLVNFYTYISYFHMAAVISLTDYLGIDFILQMILIKMSNILIYATVLYCGLKKLKSGSYLLSATCLMPTSIFMASTLTYDWWVTAFLGYAAALYISELQSPERHITPKTIVKLLLAIAVGCAPKAVYFVLFLPILFLGKHKFASKKHRKGYVFASTAILLAVLLSFVLPFLVNTGTQTDYRGGTDVNAGEQLSYILSNPLEYANTLLNFLSDYTSFSTAAEHCCFHAYLYNPWPIYATAMLAVLMLCVFVDKKECDCIPNLWRHRLLTYLCSFGTLCMIATALYISFTPVGHNWINGCQWRYIIPVLFPLFYCVGSPRLINRMSERVMGFAVFGVLGAVLIGSFYQVYICPMIG